MKIFWSWQDDSPGKTNRHFIRGALEEAVAAIQGDYEAEDAERPELDHDTKGVAGAKEIVPTIMAKIASSVAFVADVTPIGRTAKGKALPNPNVMVELGWSLNKPGDGQQIYILNMADGWKIEQLPFDIRHRRVLTYTLAETDDGKIRERAKKRLVKDLTGAINVMLAEHLNEKAQATPAVGVEAKIDEPSIWAGGEAEFRHIETMHRSGWQKVAIPAGPRAYLRVIPNGWKSKAPTTANIRNLDTSRAPSAMPGSSPSGSFGATENGYVRYWIASENEDRYAAQDVSMYFEATGEFWIIHGSAVVENAAKQRFLQLALVFKGWSTALRRINWLFDYYGALPARRVEVGFTGLDGVHFPSGWIAGSPPARRSAMRMERTRRDWSNATVQEDFLVESLSEVFALFDLDPLSPEAASKFVQSNDPSSRLLKKVLAAVEGS